MSYLRIPRFYVQVSRESLITRNVLTGKEHKSLDVSPFQHSRVIIADFEKAQLLVSQGILLTRSKAIFRPIIVIHWVSPLNGGLTPIEARALKEIGLGAVPGLGAYKVFVLAPLFCDLK